MKKWWEAIKKRFSGWFPGTAAFLKANRWWIRFIPLHLLLVAATVAIQAVYDLGVILSSIISLGTVAVGYILFRTRKAIWKSRLLRKSAVAVALVSFGWFTFPYWRNVGTQGTLPVTIALVISGLLLAYLTLRMLVSREKFFAAGEQDRIYFVQVGGNFYKAIGNLRSQNKWVHPKTGRIFKLVYKDGVPTHYIDWMTERKKKIKGDEEWFLTMTRRNWFARFLESKFGWYFMSWNPDAYIREGTFSRFQVKGDDNRQGQEKLAFVFRQETTKALFPAGLYAVTTHVKTGVSETIRAAAGAAGPALLSEQIPVELQFAVEIEITDAFLAQYKIPTDPYFLAPLTAGVESAARGIAGEMTYDDLTSAPTEGEDSPWFRIANELNTDQEGGNPSMIEENGVRVIAVHLINQRITDADLDKAVAEYYKARRSADAAIEKARGDRATQLVPVEVEAKRITDVETPRQRLQIDLLKAKKEHDPEAKQAMATAIEKTNIKYLGGGAPLPFVDVTKE